MVGQHPWAKHTDSEVRFIGRQLPSSSWQLGLGPWVRGWATLHRSADLGAKVVGVDYLESSFWTPEKKHPLVRAQRDVELADCRYVELPELFDVGLCLYDVIGSYAERGTNSHS